jgi:hypothetical protein
MSDFHKSARGKVVDMNRLMSQNELMVAVSNVKINARGDELGPGGQIIRNQNSGESSYVGVPVESHTGSSNTRSTPAPVLSEHTVVTEAPIALVQPIPEPIETKPLEKTSKGK